MPTIYSDTPCNNVYSGRKGRKREKKNWVQGKYDVEKFQKAINLPKRGIYGILNKNKKKNGNAGGRKGMNESVRTRGNESAFDRYRNPPIPIQL